MHHVLQVESGFFLRRMLLSQSANLGPSRHSRFYVEPLTLPLGVVLDPVGGFRSRANQTHVSAQNIPELRHFGDAELLQDSFVTRYILAVAIGVQTVHPEVRAKLPATKLTNEGPPFLGEQCNRTKGHKGNRDYQQRK